MSSSASVKLRYEKCLGFWGNATPLLGGRLAVFWKAVDEAIESSLGLVEASEVVEPNPFNLNATRSLTNLFNCYPDGALLYEEAAIQQIAEAQRNDESQVPMKKGFFARLFRK